MCAQVSTGEVGVESPPLLPQTELFLPFSAKNHVLSRLSSEEIKVVSNTSWLRAFSLSNLEGLLQNSTSNENGGVKEKR